MGETFRALVLRKGPVTKAELVSASFQGAGNASFHVPTGHWRDGICDCCSYGFCHEQFWLTFCCHFIALGQVMTRLNINALGKPSSTRLARGWTRPFYVMFILTIIYWLFNIVYFTILGVNPASQAPVWFHLYLYSFIIYFVYVHTRTRNLLRRKYKIGNSYGCLGDCCWAYWCAPCSICQMASHTVDYRGRHKSRCCTETGLDEDLDDVEPLVPLELAVSSAHIV